MNRTNIIQILINKIDAKSYLEIGVASGDNFKRIRCDTKISVDPDHQSVASLHITSDEFFASNSDMFDVIFIDGLHHSDQVLKDIENSLSVLNENGYIVCHDMNPITKESQTIPFSGGDWNGDCWKAFVELRRKRKDLQMHVINTDHGCGIITRGSQEILNIQDSDITFENFDANRQAWINLIEWGDYEIISGYLQSLLDRYILDSEDVENNFNLAYYYDEIGQTASALSYYLRCAEHTNDKLLQYECLIRSAMCFEKQGTRKFTVQCLLQHAVTMQPKRPEGYYLLSRHYEHQNNDGHWFDSYTIASIGEQVCENDISPLRTCIDYPGFFGLLYQKALASWWCGLCDESRKLFLDLLQNYDLDTEHRNSVIDNLIKLNGFTSKSLNTYDKSKYSRLKVQFNNSNIIENNFSEAYQDIFVLTMLNGKTNGTYLEIGAGHPSYGNNTLLLEQSFNWNGLSIDINEEFIRLHKEQRKNSCILKDALFTNFDQLLSGLNFPKYIDYLQLDCDPPDVTFNILLNIPFELYKFAVITYEHDYYCDKTKSFQAKACQYLATYGYVRVVNNISPDDFRCYEDWWVHPDLVNHSIINTMKCISNDTKKAEDYILNQL